MPVFNSYGLVPDPWVIISEGESPPDDVPAVVLRELFRVKSEGEAVNVKRYGIVLTPEDDITSLISEFHKLDLIVIRSTSFKDGRIFSLGRLIRYRHGFSNELRLQGDFIPDQIPFLVRCGFNSFDVSLTFDIAAALRLLKLFPFNYQHGNFERSVISLRHPVSGTGTNGVP